MTLKNNLKGIMKRNEFIMAWGGSDTGITTGQSIGIICSQTSWGADSTRRYDSPYALFVRLFGASLAANNNTDDGATLIFKELQVTKLTITIDQATGSFINTTDIETTTAGSKLHVEYTEATLAATISCQGVAVIAGVM